MDLSKILFLDIETIPQHQAYNSAPDDYQKLWAEKARLLVRAEDDTAESLFDRAGIYAEFGQIICISAGFINHRGSMRELRVKSFYGDDEKILLKEFAEMLNKHFGQSDNLLCAHNGKEFDYPYIARRMLINGIHIPNILNIAGKKPWEVQHLDTMQMWKFGDYKSYTSLKLLAHVFGLPTPKDDIDGSQVSSVYWQEQNLERIVKYCEKDVVTLVQVYLKMTELPILKPEEIVIPSE